MSTVNIAYATQTVNLVIETWQRGTGGQADTCLSRQLLSTPVTLGPSATTYLVVREFTDDDAKTVDNW